MSILFLSFSNYNMGDFLEHANRRHIKVQNISAIFLGVSDNTSALFWSWQMNTYTNLGPLLQSSD